MTSIIKVNTIQDVGGNNLLISNGSGSITTNNIGGQNTPAFSAYLSSDQGSLSSNTDHKITINAEDFDTTEIEVFEETIIKAKYHMQAAFYLDALQMENYYIFAIEKTAPYGLCVYKMGKSIIEEGRKEYTKGLHIMKKVWDTGISKDYNNEKIKTVSL